MSARRLTLTTLASLCALVGVLLVGSVPAWAAQVHVFSASIGSPGGGEGQFSSPAGVAVLESTGYVYVVDRGNNRVEYFSSAGAYIGQFNGSTAPTGAFSSPEAIAVDNSTHPLDPSAGDVYVTDTGHKAIDKFSSTGAYIGQLTEGESGHPFGELYGVAVDSNGLVWVYQSTGELDSFSNAIANTFQSDRSSPFGTSPGFAVDSEDNLYVNRGAQVVAKLNSKGEALSEQVDGEATTAVAVDPSSDSVYVDNLTTIGGFSAGGSFVERFGTGHLTTSDGVAVSSSSGAAYATDTTANLVDVFTAIVIPDVTTGGISNLKFTSATLNGHVDPAGGGNVTSCQLEYGTSASYGQTAPCSPQPPYSSPTDISADITGLQPDTTYHYRVDAGNASGANEGQDQTFTTSGPGIDDESASTVTSVSATLNAAINPNKTPTTYYFQYGTTGAYGSDVPAPPGVSLGSGEGDLNVSVHLQGLAAGTTYHYRVIAIGELKGEVVTAEGPDKTFTTQALGTTIALPDGRTWELVTPPNKLGAGIIAVGNEQGDDIQAAQDGGGITYGATSPITGGAAGASSPEVTQALSTRRAPGSWETRDVTPPHGKGAWSLAVGHSAEYKLFSSDLSLGFVEPADDTPLPPLPPSAEKTVYLRHNGECGPTPAEALPATCYQALATAENLAPGAKIDGYGAEGDGDIGFVNATPNLSHVVLQSNYGVPLTSTPGDNGGSYVWTAGKLTWLGGAVPGNAPHVISNDGSRVVGTGLAGHEGLDLLDLSTGETVQVDAGQGAATYWTASGDDSRVFFSSGEDLWVFEVTSGSGEPLAGKATDLTVDKNVGENAGVQGVPGASEDGSYVYFVASGVLSSSANGDGEKATPGASNFYVVRYDEASKAWMAPVFIATLSGEDSPSWSASGRAHATARVSPNGRYLTFMSDRSLTGYNNRDANSGVPDEEVFLYDASADRLVCASCNPTGARPVGLLEGNAYEENLVDYAKIWQGRWFAANVPGWTSTDLSTALYQSRYLSSSGRLFFNSNDALVPADVNGTEDVYEYEPAGVGSCQPPGYGQSASVVYSESLDGCVGLISSGTSAEESAFMDASEGGGDVFFLTLSKLETQDYDTSIDIYDAHECTASVPCAPPPPLVPPPCTTGDSCKSAPTSQPTVYGAPSSETFSGAGNITQSPEAPLAAKGCGHGDVERRGACVKKKRAKRVKRKVKRAKRSTRRGK